MACCLLNRVSPFIACGVCDAGICGCTLTNECFRWNGRDFNPFPFLPCLCSFCYVPQPWGDITNTSVSMTDLWAGHEAVVGFFVPRTCTGCPWCGDICISWVNYDGDVIFEFCSRFEANPSEGGFNWAWSYAVTGIRDFEIDCSGCRYCFVICGKGDNANFEDYSCVLCVDITITQNRLCLYSGSEGSMWITGENIYYIDAFWHNGATCQGRTITGGYCHCIRHDGSTYCTCEDAKGQIFVPAGNFCYLEYVDSSGDLRRTLSGTTKGNPCCDGIGEDKGAGKSGFIWAQGCPGFNRTHLMVINECNYQYRIGNGCTF